MQQVHFTQPGQEATLLDYLHEVQHTAERVARLENNIREAIAVAPPKMQAVIRDLQALRGVAQLSAVTIVTELGQISRFQTARQLMAYSGAVSSEHSSGKRQQRGQITKTGNAHLRRVVIEAAWAYRHRPSRGAVLRQRQQEVSEEVKEIAWKAQHRLHRRYRLLAGKGKDHRKIITAVGRELLGFIWAIGIETEAVQPEQRAATA